MGPSPPSRALPSGFALLLLCLLSACGPDPGQLDEHRERGAAHLEAGRHRAAALELRSALQIDPNDAETHFALAQAYWGAGEFKAAFWEIEETVRLDPAHVEARTHKAQLMLYGPAEEKEQGLALARTLTEEHPDSAETWIALGTALNRLDRFEESIPVVSKAASLDPEDIRAIRLLAAAHTALGDREKAEPFYQRFCQLDPGLRSFAEYTRFLSQDRERDEDVYELLVGARDVVPRTQRVEIYALLADFLLYREHYDQAEDILRKGIGAEGGSLSLFYKLARIQAARGNRVAAEATMDEAVEFRPYDPFTHLEVAKFRREQGDIYGALAAADRAVALAPRNRTVRMRHAELRLEEGYDRRDRVTILQAAEEAEAVLEENPSDPAALFVMAKVAFAKGDYDEAVASAQRAVDVAGHWGEAYFVMGSALYLQGELPGARTHLANALRYAPFLLEADRLLARVHSRLGEDQLVLDSTVRVLRRNGSDAEMRVLLAQSLIRLDRMEEALAVLERVPEGSRPPEISYALARIRALEGDRTAARRLLTSAHAKDTAHFDVLRDLLELDRLEDRLPESKRRIRQATSERPDDARLVVLRAQAALFAGELEDAEKHLRRALEIDPNEQLAYQVLGAYLVRSGRTDEMIATYEAALANDVDSAAINTVLGSIYERQGRTGDALARYEAAVRADPSLGVAKNNLAQLLVENGGDLERALELAQQAKELLPNHPFVADTLGWVLYRKGVPEPAVDYFREAERGLGDDHPSLGEVRYRLALAHEASGDRRAARRSLREALDSVPDGDAKPEWAADARARLIRLHGGLL